MKDWRKIHKHKVETEGRQLLEKTSLEQSKTNAKQGKYPPGSMYMWSLEEMYGPPKEKSR